MADTPPPERVVCQLRLRLGSEIVECQASIPAARIRLVDLLPTLQGLSNAIVAAAVRQVEREGRAVSCRRGCGACCRQPVPIAEPEAIQLAELIDAMAAERRELIRRRFRDGIERLAAAGLLDAVRGAPGIDDREARQRLGLDYFRQQIPCPFLDDDSCSIHPYRPLACREYLVTSDPAQCSAPGPDAIDRVALPAKLSVALYRFGDGAGEGRPRWVPLLLALEWAASHRDACTRRSRGRRLFQRFVRLLSTDPSLAR